MPGVNLDFLPATEAPEALGSPDSACAESGLEEMIGDLLAREEVEDEEEQFCKRKFELTLQCAVGEMHSDLQAFGKQVDARLVEAAAQVAPLAEALAKLQEENMRLRVQQEMLARQVEVLCQAMGLADPSLHVLSSTDCSPSVPCDTKTSASDFPALSNDFPVLTSDPPTCTPETPRDTLPGTPQDSPSSLAEDTPTSASLDIPSSVQQEPQSEPQSSDSPSAVPHPPAFATHRSLSAPSLMANISCNHTMVLFSVIASDHQPFLVI